MSKKLTTEEFIEKAKLVHGDKYDYSKVDYVKSSEKVIIICPIHGEFWQIPSSHLSGKGCIKCSGKYQPTTEEFIEKAKEVHGDKYDYSKVEYVNANAKVVIICPIHGEFEQTPSSHLSGQGCPICSRNVKLTTEEFIKKAIIVHKNNRSDYDYDYSKVKYVNAFVKVCINCIEHGDFWQEPRHHLNGCGCQKCAIKGGEYKYNTSNTDDFIEKAKIIHCEKYDYSKVEYVNSHTKVCIICPIHEEFWQRPSDHLRGKGCIKCNESHLEKDTAKLLDENNIKYECQKRFEWIGRQSLDFYLPEYKIAIECQGRQHFEPVDYFGGEKAFIKSVNRDKKKLKLCKEHNIDMIYINHFDSEEEINNKLKFVKK